MANPGRLSRMFTMTCLVAGGLAALLARRMVAVTVHGRSMEPTYRSGDRVLVRRCRGARVRRGQVVVVAAPRSNQGWPCGTAPVRSLAGDWIIKRAVAVAGDPVPAAVAPTLDTDTRTVPDGSLVVIGDGARSGDSRIWGLVPDDQVLGVVVYVRRRRATDQSERGADPAPSV